MVLLATPSYATVTYKGVTATGVYTSSGTGVSVIKVLLPLGDSITVGAGSTYGYRKQLQDSLGIGEYDFVGSFSNPSSDATYDVHHAGVSGENTTQILARLQGELDTNFDGIQNGSIILIHAGTNGVSSGSNVPNVQTMLDRIFTKNPGIKVYVALIIPNKVGATETATIAYNASLLSMLQTYQGTNSNVHIVDMHSNFINDTFGTCSGDWATNCMGDNTHPNTTGYTSMGLQWASCISSSSNTNCDGN